MLDLVSEVSSTISGLREEFNIIAHNVANMGTVGFKRRCNILTKSLTAQGVGETAQSGDGVDLETAFDFTQGSLVETGRPLDFALVGKGFFVIETPEGPLYTRNGMFRVNENGQIVDTAGRIVAGEAGPITIPANVGHSEIGVSSEGSLSAGTAAIGKFRLVDFGENEKELLPAGINCFETPEDVRPDTPKNLIVKQGFEESSNVQMVEELVDMMMVSKLYEANMQLVSVKRDTTKSIIDLAMS